MINHCNEDKLQVIRMDTSKLKLTVFLNIVIIDYEILYSEYCIVYIMQHKQDYKVWVDL